MSRQPEQCSRFIRFRVCHDTARGNILNHTQKDYLTFDQFLNFAFSTIAIKGSQYASAGKPIGSPGYQDLDALRLLNFSKGNDVFATACVIFEMDTRGALLYYPNIPQDDTQIYIDAHLLGRAIGLRGMTMPGPSSQRQSLVERSQASQFANVIEGMINPKNRISAKRALKSTCLRTARQKVGLSSADINTRKFLLLL